MPATPARIGFVLEEFRIASSISSSAANKYGDAARKSDVIETYFVNEADALAICDERKTLLSADHRRFGMVISGEQTGIDIQYTTESPCAQTIDDERNFDAVTLISEITVNFAKSETRLELWGGGVEP